MTGHTYKPGDVITIGSGVRGFVTVRGGLSWVYWPDGSGSHPTLVNYARRLAVIDPEDREQVERVLESLRGMSFSAHACGAFACLQVALREFADHTPPKCEAALNIKGEHFACDLDADHVGLAHSNRAAEAIWGERP